MSLEKSITHLLVSLALLSSSASCVLSSGMEKPSLATLSTWKPVTSSRKKVGTRIEYETSIEGREVYGAPLEGMVVGNEINIDYETNTIHIPLFELRIRRQVETWEETKILREMLRNERFELEPTGKEKTQTRTSETTTPLPPEKVPARDRTETDNLVSVSIESNSSGGLYSFPTINGELIISLNEKSHYFVARDTEEKRRIIEKHLRDFSFVKSACRLKGTSLDSAVREATPVSGGSIVVIAPYGKPKVNFDYLKKAFSLSLYTQPEGWQAQRTSKDRLIQDVVDTYINPHISTRDIQYQQYDRNNGIDWGRRVNVAETTIIPLGVPSPTTLAGRCFVHTDDISLAVQHVDDYIYERTQETYGGANPGDFSFHIYVPSTLRLEANYRGKKVTHTVRFTDRDQPDDFVKPLYVR